MLQEKFTDSQVEVNASGNNFDILIVSEVFRGLSPVKKQQLVYAVLNPFIASGDIHAVNMKTLTPDEWQA